MSDGYGAIMRSVHIVWLKCYNYPVKHKTKIIKVLLWIFGGLATILLILALINIVLSGVEYNGIKDSYGQYVQIDGGRVHVDIQGNAKKVVVLLPGLGVPAPALEFKQLVDNLKKDFTVVVYEGFGYGLSDDTTKPRSTDNIVSEIHQTISKLGYKKYSIIAHSVSGLYALKYSLTHTNEVEAVVGIDTSVPEQLKSMPSDLQKQQAASSITTGLLRFAGGAGLIRAYLAINPNAISEMTGRTYTDEERLLANKLMNRNFTSSAVLDETVRSDSDSGGLSATSKFPSDIPVRFYLSNQSQELFPKWKEIHIAQLPRPNESFVTVLGGSHFLYNTHANTIADGFRSLLNER